MARQGHAVLDRMQQKVATHLTMAQMAKKEKFALYDKLHIEYEQLERSRHPEGLQTKRIKARARTERNRMRKGAAAELPLLDRYAKGLSAIENFRGILREISMLGGIGSFEFRQKIGRIKTEAKRIPNDPVTYTERHGKKAIARLRQQLRGKH